MKNIYCPRCGGITPGLDEDDFHEFALVYNKCVQNVKDYRSQHGTSLANTPTDELYRPAIDKYEELTGFRGADAFHLYRKHQVSRFKLFCDSCNLYYLAPKTGKCPKCGIVNQS
jgi:Zn finger protein HypA/HybF involved in hydrogenase expression